MLFYIGRTIQKVKSYRQSGYDQMKIAVNEIAGNLECSIQESGKIVNLTMK